MKGSASKLITAETKWKLLLFIKYKTMAMLE